MILDIQSNEFRQDPYSCFKKLRADTPVCQIKPHGHWAVSRYSDVQIILKNPEIFSSAGIVEEPNADSPEFFLYSRGLIGTDRPDHTRLRRLLSKAFTPERIRQFEPKIRRICQRLIEDMLDRNSVDFVQAFSIPLPIMVIAELMGIDPERMQDFRRWTSLLLTWRQNLTKDMMNDVNHMFHYFSDVIASRKREPKSDCISFLLSACENDNIISSGELLGFIRLLLVAGTDTTTHLLSNAMVALINHPEQLKQVQTDFAKIPHFIEETLRYDGPTLSLSRRVTTDIEISSVLIKKDEIVLPLVASANHDESMFTNSEDFDITRNTAGHLAFGTGIHHCLGSQLTRLQARIAFEEIFTAFSNIEKIGNEPMVYVDSFFFRGATMLPLKFTNKTYTTCAF